MAVEINADFSDLHGWEVLDEARPAFGEHDEVAAAAAQIQAAITSHEPIDEAQEWSEVVIDLPAAERGRRSAVTFKRLRNPQRQSKSVPALDLSKSADELLATVTVSQVIRSSNASAVLLGCVARSKIFTMTALDFLADDESERHFLEVAGMRRDLYFEIVDTLNAFAILLHRTAEGSNFVYRPTGGTLVFDEDVGREGEQSNVQGAPARPAAEVLERTRLGQLVLQRGSPALRRALSHTESFKMSIQAFLEHNDAEMLLCAESRMNVGLYIELCDLVGGFTTETLRASH